MGDKRRIKVHLTRLGRYYAILAAGIFLAAMVRQVNLLLLLAGLVAAPLVFSVFLARRNLLAIKVRRRLPHRISAGDLLVVEIEIERTARRGHNWLLTLTDQVIRMGEPDNDPRNRQKLSPQVTFFFLCPGRPQVASYRGRLVERGQYAFGPIRVTTRFPLGLVEASLEVPIRQTLLVYPRLGILNFPAFQRSHFNHEGQTRLERRSDRASGDFYGLRQWRPGDSPRLVHWRSSLRHNDLLVRQFDRPRHRDVVIGLILRTPDDPSSEDLEQVEKAIRFVATLVHDLCRQGSHHIALGIAGKKTEWVIGPSSPGFRDRALELLALADANPQNRVDSFMADIRRRASPESDVITVTSYEAEPLEDQILETIPSIKGEAGRQESESMRFVSSRGWKGTYTVGTKEFDLIFLDQF